MSERKETAPPLDAFIIEEIKKEEEEKKRREGQIQPEVPLDPDPRPRETPPSEKPDEKDRGVTIIDPDEDNPNTIDMA